MPFFLNKRDTKIRELMDDPECDIDRLNKTFRLFRTINSAISRWKKIYRNQILPDIKKEPERKWTLLDIGSGGGDIPAKILNWARLDGIELNITAIDPDPRACDFARKQDYPGDINFLQADTTELVKQNELFDFVISNHLVHHLDINQFSNILNEAVMLSSHKVLFNDIERSDTGYLAYNIISRLLFDRSSFAIQDGLASIKRSFTYKELKASAPEGWHIKRIFPYRLLLWYKHG